MREIGMDKQGRTVYEKDGRYYIIKRPKNPEPNPNWELAYVIAHEKLQKDYGIQIGVSSANRSERTMFLPYGTQKHFTTRQIASVYKKGGDNAVIAFLYQLAGVNPNKAPMVNPPYWSPDDPPEVPEEEIEKFEDSWAEDDWQEYVTDAIDNEKITLSDIEDVPAVQRIHDEYIENRVENFDWWDYREGIEADMADRWYDAQREMDWDDNPPDFSTKHGLEVSADIITAINELFDDTDRHEYDYYDASVSDLRELLDNKGIPHQTITDEDLSDLMSEQHIVWWNDRVARDNPIPKPHKGEGKSFIGRCMKESVMKQEFPKQKQRLAVCFSQKRRTSHNPLIRTPSEIEWVNAVLHNDESSTDDELIGYFMREGQMSQEKAWFYVKQRQDALIDMNYRVIEYAGGN